MRMRRWMVWVAVALLVQAVYGQSAKRVPQTEQVLTAARVLAESGKLQASEQDIQNFLAKNPSSADAYFLLGYVYFREQKPKDSLAAFTEGARFRRPAADDLMVIASAYVLLKDYPDAEKWFSVVTTEKPGDVDAWYLLGRTQYVENHFTAAIASFNKSLALRPHYVEAENNLGLAWQGLNRVNRAMAAYRTAIQWQDVHPVDAQPYLNLGIALTDQNQPRKALPWLEEAAKLAPKNPRVHVELARALQADHRLGEAQHQLESAVALAPDASGPHFKLGRLYQLEGFKDLARQQFDICQKLLNSHVPVDTPNPYQRP